MKLFITTIAIFIVAVSGLYLIYSKYFINSGKKLNSANILNQVLASPSPLAFQELTIPYLRQKTYQSNLGELDQLYKSSNFTAYLTSYTSDGLKINGLITKPDGEIPEGGWPGIVFIHGYIAPTIYKTTEKYEDYVNYLARNGYVVFKIDLRGHDKSEGEASGAYYSSDYIVDTLNAYSALQNSGFVNPNKIGLWGHSMAGNIVLRTIAAKPDIPAADIWAGAVYTYKDWAEFGISDNSYRPPSNNADRMKKRQQLMDTYGDPKDGNPFWDLVAATNYLSDYKGAIQINHAVDDDVVNIGYSRNLNEILNQTQIPHELIEYPNGGHNITNPSFTAAMQNTVNFFDKYLKN